jgi:hypothetical protein
MCKCFIVPTVYLCLVSSDNSQLIITDEHVTDGVCLLPDGLAQFRLNLEELLVDICLLLGAPAYINKVYISFAKRCTLIFFHGYSQVIICVLQIIFPSHQM